MLLLVLLLVLSLLVSTRHVIVVHLTRLLLSLCTAIMSSILSFIATCFSTVLVLNLLLLLLHGSFVISCSCCCRRSCAGFPRSHMNTAHTHTHDRRNLNIVHYSCCNELNANDKKHLW
ncbi:unnamed protein product [Polarella glacialis]|uniref:Secreted peptide n=1 Tax=Polarella glacialis TaxID=89957 RepID=A0A813GY62_POLGL|nr:unnamed protein product [Polarella glacialis]